jgi:hypothetical protein
VTSPPHPADPGAGGRSPRTGPADRRLGERRLQLVPVDTERRTQSERRRRISRRESVSGHIRNAIQVLESAIVVAERDGVSVEPETLVAILLRLRSAMREVDRLAGDRQRLGRLLRVSEQGLPPDALPGLVSWPR